MGQSVTLDQVLYNTSYQTSTGMTPFWVVYGKDTPNLLPYNETRDAPPLVAHWLSTKDKVLSQLKSNLLWAQLMMKSNVHKNHSEVSFKEREWVFVKFQPYHQHLVLLIKNQKLEMKYFGLFHIEQKIGSVTYRLHLPIYTKIHLVFHISLLKPYIGNPSFTTMPLPLVSSAHGPMITLDVLL